MTLGVASASATVTAARYFKIMFQRSLNISYHQASNTGAQGHIDVFGPWLVPLAVAVGLIAHTKGGAFLVCLLKELIAPRST